MLIVAIALPVILALVLIRYFKNRRKRQKLLASIREGWGKPNIADRNYRLIALYKNLFDAAGMLPQTTADDLDLDAVFAFADRTYSKPGQQYLYRQIHSQVTNADTLKELDKRVEALPDDRGQLEEMALKLSELGSNDAAYIPQLFTADETPLFSALAAFYIKTSGLFIIVSLVLMIIGHSQVFFLLLMALCIGNLAMHYSTKNKIYRYTHSLPQLLVMDKVAQWLSKQPHTRVNDELKQAMSHVASLRRSLSFVNLENSTGTDPTDLSFFLLELLNILFLLQPLMFLVSVNKINSHRGAICSVYEYVAECDLLLCIRSLRDSLPFYTKPEFVNDSNLQVDELYHPLVDGCVPNSMHTSASQGVLITGSNMSGKTTFIRAMAINTLLAQTLYTSCSKSYRAPWLNIHTSIRLSDDVEEHKSYFQAEALSVLDILKRCESGQNRNLVIIDEIFKGTNTIERVAAAKAVLAYLTAHQNFVFVSTHDLELAELLGADYAVYSFEETLSAGSRLVFDYKIKPGLLKKQNGIAVLGALGYPDVITADANKVSEQLRQKYQL